MKKIFVLRKSRKACQKMRLPVLMLLLNFWFLCTLNWRIIGWNYWWCIAVFCWTKRRVKWAKASKGFPEFEWFRGANGRLMKFRKGCGEGSRVWISLFISLFLVNFNESKAIELDGIVKMIERSGRHSDGPSLRMDHNGRTKWTFRWNW